MSDLIDRPAQANNLANFQINQRPVHWIQERIHLFWVYKSSRISVNVLRAVCDYLRLQSVLVHLKNNQIRYFDITLRKWKSLCKLNIDLSKDYGGGYTLTMCGADIFVVCGGLPNKIAAHIIEDGIVTALPNLIYARYCHGAVYIPLCYKVYVFGGADTSSIKYCESFDLLSRSWQAVASMHKRRAGINPLLYGHLIYIVGGDGVLTVETYEWRRDSFTLLPLFEGISSYHVQAVITGNSVLCISDRCNYRIHLLTNQILDIHQHERIRLLPIVSMAISDNVAIFTDWCSCALYSLADGTQIEAILDY